MPPSWTKKAKKQANQFTKSEDNQGCKALQGFGFS
jgi:hypothetical protein